MNIGESKNNQVYKSIGISIGDSVSTSVGIKCVKISVLFSSRTSLLNILWILVDESVYQSVKRDIKYEIRQTNL